MLAELPFVLPALGPLLTGSHSHLTLDLVALRPTDELGAIGPSRLDARSLSTAIRALVPPGFRRWNITTDVTVDQALERLASPAAEGTRLAVVLPWPSEDQGRCIFASIAALGVPAVAVRGERVYASAEDVPIAAWRDGASLLRAVEALLAGEAGRPHRDPVPQGDLATIMSILPRTTERPLISRAKLPPVSVVVTVHNRYDFLEQALLSLHRQTYRGSIETIVVDDGSEEAAAANITAIVARIRELPGAGVAGNRMWKLLRLPRNVYLGGARNRGRRLVTAPWIMFMDDDNVAKPQEVQVFVNALLSSPDTAIFTCQSDSFSGADPPKEPVANPALIEYNFLPFGGSAAGGVFENVYGDANFIVRASVLDELGGFSEDRASFEDWELLVRAQTSGFEVAVIPEVLFWKRTLGDSMLRVNARGAAAAFGSAWRTLRPYVGILPGRIGGRLLSSRKEALATTEFADSILLAGDSWEQWSKVQGTGGWHVGYRERTAAALGPFVPFGAAERTASGWELFGDPPLPRWLHASRGKQHGAVGDGGKGFVVVRRWISSVVGNGEARLTATRPDHVGSCGDGSELSIAVLAPASASTPRRVADGGEKVLVAVAGRPGTETARETLLRLNVTVNVGTIVEFRQDPLRTAECDELWVRGSIVVLREPAP
ncbi:nucleotide-diphospho-sugar transferase [Hyaloraphidium curvatum]|nr:nucleotide-diphospho-sugar transferase [Hyaloraphidium curvatum]